MNIYFWRIYVQGASRLSRKTLMKIYFRELSKISSGALKNVKGHLELLALIYKFFFLKDYRLFQEDF